MRYGSNWEGPDVELADIHPELRDEYDTLEERALFGPKRLEPKYGRRRKARPVRNSARRSRSKRLAGDRR